MDSKKLNDWLQVVGVFGVILSLIFVGLEIQQSREIAIADNHQQKAAMAIQVQQGFVSADRCNVAIEKALYGGDLTKSDIGLLQFAQNPWFQYWENNYFQYQMGLLSETAWQASRSAMRDRLRREIYRDWWKRERKQWRANFAKEVDQIVSELDAEQ